MALPEIEPSHQTVIRRFTEACRADERVVAAFLGGSYAKGTADAYSDLDLYLITMDEAYGDFFAGRAAFMRHLCYGEELSVGRDEPLFLEDWNRLGFDMLFFILPDGTEGELGLGRESQFSHIHGGPYKVLVDKKGILAGAVFPLHEPEQAKQIETLRQQIFWFWHDLSHHFTTELARGHLWAAYGALEDLRRTCVNLARLSQNFSAGAEGYEKVEQAVPVEQLSPLEATFCPLEQGAMLRAAFTIVLFYRELAPTLAQAHGITYPTELERVMYNRLEKFAGALHVSH